MPGNSGGATETGWNSRDSLLFVGQAPLPGSLRPFSPSGLLTVEVEIDRRSSKVVGVVCLDLSPSVQALLNDLLAGLELASAMERCIAELRRRYFAQIREALFQALELVRQQYMEWQQEGAQTELRLPLSSEPLQPDYQQWRQERKQARTPHPSSGPPVAAIPGWEPSSSPPPEPVVLPGLVERVLVRTSASHPHVPIIRNFPAGLPSVQADPSTLEEALVPLLDHVTAYASRTGNVLEVTAEGSGSEVWIALQLHGKPRKDTMAEAAGETRLRGQPDLLAQMWERSMNLLPSRPLVERQGGRIWVQEIPHLGQPHLCIALPAHRPRDGQVRRAPDR